MKRFLAFAYAQYYPSGGWSDFVGAFDTIEEARDKIISSTHEDFYEIVDLETLEIVEHESSPSSDFE